jgi:glycosyltransferase involved in cell wall biosynthesis
MKASPLILLRHYLPGFRFGGQTRSISNIVAVLKEALDIRIACLDRDHDEPLPYADITPEHWTDVKGAAVKYLAPGAGLAFRLLALLREPPFDVLYLNGVFDPYFSILPLLAIRFGFVPRRLVVVAPRGMLAPSALAIKAWKKNAVIGLLKFLRVYNGVVWHATAPAEVDDIHAMLGSRTADIRMVGVIPAPFAIDETMLARGPSKPLEAVLMSRICRIKNIEFAMAVLAKVRVPVRLTLVGSIEDEVYWQELEDIRRRLPPHVEVVHAGSVGFAEVPARLSKHDFFFLPTKGENFGHVIFEALQAGLPLVISDRTPWRDMEAAGVGFALSLEDQDGFVHAIEALAAMPDTAFEAMRRRARRYSTDWLNAQEAVAGTRDLLNGKPRADGMSAGVTPLPAGTG